jgi:hypothetical protein
MAWQQVKGLKILGSKRQRDNFPADWTRHSGLGISSFGLAFLRLNSGFISKIDSFVNQETTP